MLFEKDAVGEVFLPASVVDEGAMMTLLFVMRTSAGVVADAGTGPHIVHGPDYGLARSQNFLDVL